MSETTTEQDPQVLGEEPNTAPQPADDTAPQTGQEQPAPEQSEAPKTDGPKQGAWVQRRIDELTRLRREAERRAEMAEAQLRQSAPQTTPNAPPPGYVPVTEVERVAQTIAQEKAFNAACDDIAGEVEKIADLSATQRTFQMLGGVNRPFLEAIVELGKQDGARVYAALGADPDAAERILSLPPARMALELGRMASAAKPAKPPTSRVPEPIRPIGGGAARSGDPYSMGDEEFRKWLLENDPRR